MIGSLSNVDPIWLDQLLNGSQRPKISTKDK